MEPISPRLILASASPRRRDLLAQLGLACSILPADLEEQPRPGEIPEHYVLRMAAEKSLAVASRSDAALPVLSADTEVVLDGEIFGKPADLAAAVTMLERLSGREHLVLSALSLRAGRRHWQRLNVSRVRFRRLQRREIEAYWATGEPVGKAGGYAIQGRGAVFVEHLAGSYSGVMGLPLFETAELLDAAGIPVLAMEPTKP